jgi:hypothetical protein
MFTLNNNREEMEYPRKSSIYYTKENPQRRTILL